MEEEKKIELMKIRRVKLQKGGDVNYEHLEYEILYRARKK